MIYGEGVVYDTQSRSVSYVDIDNDWILANKVERLSLSLNKTQIIADGVDAATLTVQLTTPLLIDGSVQNKSEAKTVKLLVDGELVTVELDGSGSATLELTTVETGSFHVEAVDLGGDPVVIEGVNNG